MVKIAEVKPAVNQIHMHPYNYHEHASLLEYQAKHGIVTEAYGSLAWVQILHDLILDSTNSLPNLVQ